MTSVLLLLLHLLLKYIFQLFLK